MNKTRASYYKKVQYESTILPFRPHAIRCQAVPAKHPQQYVYTWGRKRRRRRYHKLDFAYTSTSWASLGYDVMWLVFEVTSGGWSQDVIFFDVMSLDVM